MSPQITITELETMIRGSAVSEQAWTAERQAAAQARCEALVSGEPGLQLLCNRMLVDTRWDDSALLLALRQALIAALTDLPAALAELSRLPAENARLRAVVEAAEPLIEAAEAYGQYLFPERRELLRRQLPKLAHESEDGLVAGLRLAALRFVDKES